MAYLNMLAIRRFKNTFSFFSALLSNATTNATRYPVWADRLRICRT